MEPGTRVRFTRADHDIIPAGEALEAMEAIDAEAADV